jgi:NAD kinase
MKVLISTKAFAESLEIREQQEKNLDIIQTTIKEQGSEVIGMMPARDLTPGLVERCDLIVSGGGDGTTLITSRNNSQTLQLNLRIDDDSKGNLCEKKLRESIIAVISGTLGVNYEIKKWTRQAVYLNNKPVGIALNGIVLSRPEINPLIEYTLRYTLNPNVETPLWMEDHHKSSGLIIATGTGSTGWPAAFKQFNPEEKMLRYSAILLFSGKHKEGNGAIFQVIYESNILGGFELDTKDRQFEISNNSKLEIKVNEYPLLVAVPKLLH